MHESEKWKWSRSVVSDSVRPHGLQPTRLLCPWYFPGKSTGVGCHRLLCFFLYLWSNKLLFIKGIPLGKPSTSRFVRKNSVLTGSCHRISLTFSLFSTWLGFFFKDLHKTFLKFMNLYKLCVYLKYFKKEKNNESIWTNSLQIYILVKIELTWMSKENQINKKVSLIFTLLPPQWGIY